MAKDKANSSDKQGANVIGMTICPVDKCGQRAVKDAFCNEHFTWFKEGLINRRGERPKDFDKKYQAFLIRHKKAA